MKQALVTILVFVGAVLFFAWVTGIASEIQANGFNWPKIVQIAKGDDNMIWLIFPAVCVVGTIGYWAFNRN